MLHQAPNLWTITWKVWKEKTILHYHVRAGLLLSPWTKEKKEVINPPPKWNNNILQVFFSNTHQPHFIYSNQFMWVNDPTPLIHSTKKSSSNSFPYRASRATMGRWSSWILAANERRMASLMVWKTCYPTAIPGLESYPCSTMLNTVKTHLQLNFMRHVPGLHHLTTRYKLSFLALIYNLIKKNKISYHLTFDYQSFCMHPKHPKKNTTKGRKEGCRRAAKTFRSRSPSNLERPTAGISVENLSLLNLHILYAWKNQVLNGFGGGYSDLSPLIS